jgi:hypothetical protein
MQPLYRLFAVVLMALAAACAALPAARMALPEPLAAQTASIVSGLGAGRSGAFTIGDESGRFERGADRLVVFDALSFDRVAARYTSTSTRAACRGRRTEATLGVITGQPRAFEVQCQYEGAFAGQLTLRGANGAAGTQQQRSGRLHAGGVTVDIASVHRLQGTPLPLAFPAGYVLSIDGRPAAAVELTDSQQPRAWLPAEPGPQRVALTHVALTLALLWDPSQGAD